MNCDCQSVCVLAYVLSLGKISITPIAIPLESCVKSQGPTIMNAVLRIMREWRIYRSKVSKFGREKNDLQRSYNNVIQTNPLIKGHSRHIFAGINLYRAIYSMHQPNI